MYKNNNKLKSIVFAVVVAAGMLLPMGASAQNDVRGGGLFGFGEFFDAEGLFTENDLRGGEDVELNGGISNFGIGEDENAPLGSGIALLIGAGLGYVALKKKED